MITKRLKRLLLQPGSGRGSTHSPVAKTFTFISGRTMTPRGCACLLSLAETRAGAEARPTTRVLRRRRAVVAGVAPGDLLRVAPHYFSSTPAYASDPLAAPRRCVALCQRDVSSSRAPLVARPHRPLPCPAAASPGQCQQCPWMALSSERAGGVKAEVLRAALDAAVASVPGGRLPAIAYLEPFSTPVEPNYMQEAELVFTREEPTNARAGDDLLVVPGRFRFVAHPHWRPSRTRRAGGPSLTPPLSLLPPRPCAAQADDGDGVLDRCLLASLEQKRLARALTRWARRLPAPTRASLEAAYISQPTEADSGRACAAPATHPSEAALLVTLAVRTDGEGGEGSSPLCGPAHPAEVLAVEEQRLVEAVMEAAPLVRHVAVHVMYLSPLAKGGRATGCVDCLHPTTHRGLRVAEVLRAATTATMTAMTAMGDGWSSAYGPQRRVTAVLPTGELPVVAAVPGLHSAVLARGLLGGGAVSYSPTATAGQAVEGASFTSLWRQRHALNSASSVLLSMLVGEGGEGERAGQSIYFRPPPLAALAAGPATAPAAILLSQALAALVRARGRAGSQQAPPPSLSRAITGAGSVGVVLSGASTEEELGGLVRDVRAAVAGVGSGAVLPVLLAQCSTDMTATALGQAVAELARDDSFTVVSVEAGVVDVDPLSAAFVGYVRLSLSPVSGARRL